MHAVIGLWDGHDAGAALIVDGRAVFAANEERYTRRKLEVGFPSLALAEARRYLPAGCDVQFAVSTSDPAKCLTRAVPALKESYYRLRRRKEFPGPLHQAKRTIKYALTQLPPFFASKRYTRIHFARRLRVPPQRITLVDHHAAHAAGAAFGTHWDYAAAILTLDGIGDGLSGSFWRFEQGQLSPIGNIAGRASLGLFFEHVTTQVGMRELEDEGKVMALATLASPVADADNPFLQWFKLELDSRGLPTVSCSVSPVRMAAAVARVVWSWPREQVCYMAQRTLEILVPAIAQAVLRATNTSQLGFAGGVASNIKVNRLIRTSPGIERMFVFPHMGDGGLALGAAWFACAAAGTRIEPLTDLYLGAEFDNAAIDRCVSRLAPELALNIERTADIAGRTARLIANGKVVMWFQGAMELGPRALGHRSILARPDRLEIKDDLNLRLKRRVWFQPFCPSMLASEAPKLLGDFRVADENPYMTSGFQVRRDALPKLAGVIGVDGSCRPQMVPDAAPSLYRALLESVRELTGTGAVLNTSFNLHGEPVVNTPEEAVDTWLRSDVDYLALGQLLLSKQRVSDET